VLFNYIGDISNIAHDIIKRYLRNFDSAVDATLGNGYDTDFLSNNFKKIFSFDIQNSAVENYREKKRDNVILVNSSHENLKAFVNCQVDCVMYNLGFLPGGDKSITTQAHTTIASIKEALKFLNPGGIISIAIYTGHEEGRKEEALILDFVKNLPKRHYGVLLHSFINRMNCPMLVIIEKNME
jgi:SAM-dependent methyltransferase